jgi:uncharacterized RDD family membrane protein YckC
MLVDPDPYDASEEQFAASLEESTAPMAQRFVVDNESPGLAQDGKPPSASPPEIPLAQQAEKVSRAASITDEAEPLPPQQPDLLSSDGAWRQEVTARLSRYRAGKRVPTPRYPSLQLRFEVPEPPNEERPVTLPPAPTPNRLAVAIQEVVPEAQVWETGALGPASAETGEGAKILEFPRFFSEPHLALDELAEPVLDRPRILEVPEQMPPPPVLGGILIETEEKLGAERRPGFDLPLNPPPMPRRVTAGLIDLFIVIVSFAAFAIMFFRVTHAVPPLREAAGVCVGLVAAVWVVYQYLFLVYPGATPGLKLTRLQLSRFDGTPAPRRLRRWRVLASVLSGLSLGLGYAWCFFDEDQLCWHDRITHTYMALVPSKPLTASPPLPSIGS